MKKKITLQLLFIALFVSSIANAQIAVPFNPRLPGNFIKLKGDATLIGNTIVNVAPANNPSQANNPYNGTGQNNGQNMEYINVDSAGNPTLFSSSSATLTLPSTCSRVKYAGLYWFAVYPNGRSSTTTNNNDYVGTVRTEDWFNMKFKVPGGTYVDLTADTAPDPVGSEDDIIFNGYNAANVANSFTNAPYVCYKNVTSLVQAAANPNGDYYAANVRATVGKRSSGCSGGWMLVVIYEDLNLTSKYISTFDGYASVDGNTNLSYPVNGFNTIPTGPVKAKIGVSALEGDLGLTGDRFSIKANSVGAFTVLSDAANPNNNYFNSTVSSLGAIMPNRNPASTNTLGTDIDLINLNNPANSVLPNNETGAQLKLTTTGDVYGALFSLFAVDIIEPVIPLIKIAEDLGGNNISGQNLTIGQTFYYSLNFDNTGNDNASSFTIEDTLPPNIVFPSAGNGTPILPSDLILPPGVTYTFNPVTKKFVFTIPNSLVTTTAPSYTIKIKVRAPQTCDEVVDACSNVVINQAYASYTGITSGLVTSQSPSNTGYDTCNGVTPGATNYLVNIDLCTFTQNAVLCGTSVVLTAANGYTTYQWYDSNNNPLGNTQSITVTATGTYHVVTNAPNPCASITQTFNVVDFNNAITTNPVIPYADQVVTCPNNGVLLPKIFLCGTGDSQLIQSGITNALSIVWEQLVVGSCPAVAIADCANTNNACTWNQVGTGPNYNANTPGQFRIIVNYQNGCFRIFYFNVYQNILTPTFVIKDIVCNTIGSITVNNIPTGYQYSLSPTGPFQTSNVFNISTAGVYTVYIQQIGVTNGCLFTFPNIDVISKPFSVNVIKTDKICNNGFGSINVQINNVNPQYSFQISQGATVVSTFGPSATNYHIFSNLNPGTYTVTATTQDGCLYTENVTILDYNLNATAAVINNINCNPGSINITATGGLSTYNYAIYSYNSIPVLPANYVYQTDPVFTIPTGQAGTYQFIVVDGNNCSYVTTPITILTDPTPTITATPTNVTCYNANNGIITVSSTPTSGYVITYSIDGTTFQSSNVFSSLTPGSYTITVKYTKGTNECFYTTTALITQPLQLAGQAQITQQLTCLVNGTVQATSVTGGTTPYQYSINGVTFQSGATFSNLAAGTYHITIKDAHNCVVQTNTVTLVAPLPPTDLTFSATSITCPTLKSNLTATVVGGTSAYTFQIIAPATINASSTTGASAVFNNLNPGTYTVKVTDSNGCVYQENYTINPISFIAVSGNVTANVICFGGNNGALTFNVSGFTSNYSYSVNGATAVTNQTAAAIHLTNLIAGNYSITVTDATTNCTATYSLTIAGPTTALAVNNVVSQPTCIANGSVNATATGGWGSYQYSLTLPNATVLGPQSSGLFSNLTLVGNYTVSVTDLNGCVVTKPFTINSFTNPTLVISPASSLCYNTTTGATIVVTAGGGTPGYQYQINSGALQNSNTFTNLAPGSYTIQVTDSYGCTASVNQVINPLLTAQAVIVKNLDCTASPNATIAVTIAGGLAPYQYQVKYNSGAWSALTNVTGNSFNYSAALAGNYQFQITDSKACVTLSNIITINPLVLPQITSVTQSQPILCNGDSNGAININYNNALGLAPFVINVLNTTTGVNYGTQTTGLAAGNYTITLTDANSCSDTKNIILTQPNPISFSVNTTDISCNGAGGTNFGEITVVGVSGGTMPYSYHLTNNFGYSDTYNPVTNENHTFIVLNFGIYHIEVTDANGCSLIGSDIIIASPPNDLDIDVSTATSDCTTGGTAIVTVSTAVASGSYEFGILTSNISPYASVFQPADAGTPETTTFTGLIPGVTYTFVVHDLVTNCYYFETAAAPIPSPSNVITVLNAINNVTCTGNADGNISFTISNYDAGATSVNYEVYNAQSNLTTGYSGTSTISGTSVVVTNFATLAPGLYYLLVTENGGTNAGCTSATTSFTINESTNLLSVTASLIKNDNCNLNAGIVSATAQFGTVPYQYEILLSSATPPTIATWTGATSSTFNVESGNYIVYVKDAYGCIKSTPITVNLDPSPTINLSLVNPCVNEGTYQIHVIRTVDGISPYNYSVDGGTVFTQNTTPFNISNLSSGSHIVTISDSNGCADTQTLNIIPTTSGIVAVVQQPSCANNDGELQATASNGSGTYSYTLQNNLGTTIQGPNNTGTFSGLGFGNYTVTITDASTSCPITVTTSLEQPTPVTFTYSAVNPSCFGSSDGSITVTLPASNNNAPYSYSLFDGTTTITQASPIFNNLPDGNYTVTVTSNRNCTNSQAVVISNPTVLSLSATATSFACNANNTTNTVTITAAASGGTTPYSYSIDGVNYQTSNTFTITDTGAIQNFTITVKDAHNCNATFPISINPLSTITSTLVSQVNPLTCNAPEDISITINGGSGNYTYQLLPSGTITTVTSNPILTSLAAPGSYSYQIVDTTTGCSVITAPYNINSIPILNVNANPVNGVACFGDANGTLNFTVSNYTGNYNYQVFDANTNAAVTSVLSGSTLTPTQTVTNLLAGNYYVTLTETQNPLCNSNSNVITINTPSQPVSISASQTNDISCLNNVGTILASATGGTDPYQYQLTDAIGTIINAYASANQFNGLDTGNYIVYVQDTNGCIDSTPITIGLDPTPAISISIVDPCVAEGSYEIHVIRTVDGISPYNYSVDGGTAFTQNTTPFNISNLSSGSHTVTISDSNGCADTQTLNIIPTTSGVVAVVQQPSCANNDGELQATASNGSGTYSYTLQNNLGTTIQGPNNTGTFSGLGFGNYTVTITDASTSCPITVTTSLEQPTPVTFTYSAVNPSCFGSSDGSITVTLPASNNNAPYSYSLFDGTTTITQASPIFNNLPDGNYTVTVTSNRNCNNSQAVVISNPTVLSLSATATTFACNANNTTNTVTITASASGGTTPYSYSIDGVNYQTSNTFTITDTGAIQNFTITVKDAHNCNATFPISINPLPTITSTSVTQITPYFCNGFEDVNISVTGGSGNFSFQLLPNGPTLNGSSPVTWGLTSPGTYSFEIIDLTTGCSVITAPYIVNPLTLINVLANPLNPVTCYGYANGSMQINVAGITGNYNYTLIDDLGNIVTTGIGNTVNNPLTLSNLTAGNYYVLVEDGSGALCQSNSNVINIGSPVIPVSLTVQQTAEVTCTNDQGTIIAEAEGGSGSYQYQLENVTLGTIPYPFGSISTFTGLGAGNYVVTIRDVNLCETSQSIQLIAPTPIQATNVVTNAALLCYNDTNASVTVSATGGQGVYQYELNLNGVSIAGPQIGNIFNNLGAGNNYSVTVTDGWNCTFTTLPFTITQPTPINASLSTVATLTCSPNSAQLLITASGGTPPYQYSSNGTNFNSTNTFNVGPGTYHYYVTDANNCTAVVTNDITIAPITPLNLDLDTSNTAINCNGDHNASIAATATGGLGNYMYSLLNSSLAVLQGPQSNGTFTLLGPGTYHIKVTSGDCTITSTAVIITESPAIAVNLNITNLSCNYLNSGVNDGVIQVNASGGTGVFQYAISPFTPQNLAQTETSNTFTGLAAGQYKILVQDTNGCFEILDAVVNEPTQLVATYTIDQQELCEGNNDGSITVTITGGTPPYYTSFNDDTPSAYTLSTSPKTFTNISGGQDYFIYIKDSHGCDTNVFVPMDTPVDMNPSYTIAYDCTTVSNPSVNTVTVSVTGVNLNLSDVQYALDSTTAYQTGNVFNNLANGNHTINVKNTNGCIKQLNFTIANYLPIQGTLTATNLACYNSNSGTITVTNVSGGVGPYEYAISPNYVYSSNNVFTGLAAGINYSIKIKDSKNCILELQQTLTEPTELIVTTSPAQIMQEICEGDHDASIEITVSGGVGPYQTSLNNQTNYITSQFNFFNLSGGTTYTIYVKDANGCITSITIPLDPAVNLHPIATPNYSCLNNQNVNSVTISVDPIYDGQVLYSIDGVNYQQSNVFNNLASGTYTAYVLHTNGCLKTSAPFTINHIDTLQLTAAETGLNQITATANGGVAPYVYIFNGNDNGSNNVFLINHTGIQNITVVDALGCEANFDLPATFYDIEIPNFFTPGNNGYNDGWSPKNTDNFTKIKTKIFDRYGRVIKILYLNEKWDGTYNNTPLPSGDYWYLVELNDGSDRTFVGNFTLYR